MDFSMNKRLLSVILIGILMFALSITAYADVEEEEISEPDPLPPSRILIVDHIISGDGLTAGEKNTVVFLLRNTGQEAAVSSVLITGWLDQSAPVAFIGANQAYVPRIEPGSTAIVQFDFLVQDIELALISNIASNFMIEYFDESSWVERSNTVSIRLNVTSEIGVIIGEEDMLFPIHEKSQLEELLQSPEMQKIYILGLIICCAGVALILLYRLLKRFVDWKGGKTNV